MRRHLLGFWLRVAAGVAVAACDAPPPTRSSSERAAPDGLCAAHGVLEAACPACNPALAPVYQAKGDWCAEHGLPLSFCPVHHPEAGGRPRVATADDSAPADGTKVRLERGEIARAAGLVTVAAEAQAGGATLEVLATLAYDATRRAELNARSPGVVRTLHVDVGAEVKVGTALALIDSAAVGADRSRLGATAARRRVAEAALARERDLHARGIAPLRDVQLAEQELAAAQAEHAATEAALGVVGRGTARGGYTVTAPIAGTVVRRGATVGHLVDADDVLFEIVDTHTMWAELDVPEAEAGRVVVGQTVTLQVDGGGEVTGVVRYVAPEVDPVTRTVRARVPVANPDGRLRANLFARARVELGAAAPAVTVPRDAVQRVGDVALVFVRQADELYETRRVRLGRDDGARVELLTGVTAGELVVTRGSFLLKTETMRGSIGAGCCEVD